MAGGSRGQRNAAVGNQQLVCKDDVGKLISSCDYKVRQEEQSSFLQKTSRTSYVDKQTGKYARATNKEVVSTGETFKERSTGRVGYKDEYKTTSSYKVGDKRGYTEHQLEERIRRVDYSGSSGNKKANCGSGSCISGGAARIGYISCNKYEESGGDGGEDYSYCGGSYGYGYSSDSD